MSAERSSESVAQLTASVLADDVVLAEHLPIGFGNENWRLTTSSGERFIAKFGPSSSGAKWRSAQEAQRLAASVGVPVARLVYFGDGAEEILRIFEWVEGISPARLTDQASAASRFFSELGRAVAALQSVRVEKFSSRLDGSAPSFDRWAEYIAHRLTQVRARCEATQAFDDKDLNDIEGEIQRRADHVSDAARPALCHRDLHSDNLLAREDGSLAAILDFDQSELWDATADWSKLDWMLFPGFPAACRDQFGVAYRSTQPDNELWEERKTVVDLVEAYNGIPNAIANGWMAFERECRARLVTLLK
ncbi:MAG: aminoglycoside phosphotransferase family protein [Actinomycetota bacterium]